MPFQENQVWILLAITVNNNTSVFNTPAEVEKFLSQELRTGSMTLPPVGRWARSQFNHMTAVVL